MEAINPQTVLASMLEYQNSRGRSFHIIRKASGASVSRESIAGGTVYVGTEGKIVVGWGSPRNASIRVKKVRSWTSDGAWTNYEITAGSDDASSSVSSLPEETTQTIIYSFPILGEGRDNRDMICYVDLYEDETPEDSDDDSVSEESIPDGSNEGSEASSDLSESSGAQAGESDEDSSGTHGHGGDDTSDLGQDDSSEENPPLWDGDGENHDGNTPGDTPTDEPTNEIPDNPIYPNEETQDPGAVCNCDLEGIRSQYYAWNEQVDTLIRALWRLGIASNDQFREVSSGGKKYHVNGNSMHLAGAGGDSCDLCQQAQ